MVCVLAVVLGLMVLWKARAAGNDAGEKRTMLAERRGEMEARIRHWEAAAAASEASLAVAGLAPEVLLPTVPNAAEPSPLPFLDRLATDPEFQARYFEWQRAELVLKYGAFHLAESLSSAQIAHLSDALIAYAAHLQDLRAIRLAQELPMDDPALKGQREQAALDLHAAQMEVLGSDGFMRLKEYERTLPVRSYVSKLAGTLAMAGYPLRPEQSEAVTRILAGACARYMAGGSVQFAKIDWPAAEAKTRTVLESEQMKVFRTEAGGSGPSRWRSQLTRVYRQAVENVKEAPRADAYTGGPGGVAR